jgi:hypothetical protein
MVASVKGVVDRVKKSLNDFVDRIKNYNLNERIKKVKDRVVESFTGLMKGTVTTRDIGESIR